ncbi:pentapeptide repeat-containing protein [Staphylococcus caeli]|uniref:Uncharacterized protein conserved in bacteria n=1 Tax=Staphylococcus caeli TaxID=2201815 RepID=A0A1D4H8W8_9STAP|nr:pentapeptide repeat-containing protein [Staphylococcus caeli]SCS33652.1 Uncharacterized protein conserved in bacteria [Staphylococcus caeli]SCS62081.1 Uncharacterized protein conserved in bacteria [Staphylococcus caeli]
MKVQQPKISKKLEPKVLDDIFFMEDDILELAEINKSSLENNQLKRLLIYGSYIKDCNFANADLGRVDFTDVIFENCDFSNTNMEHGSIHRAVFKHCRMTGAMLKDMRFGDIVFNEVKGDFITIIESKIEKFLIENSNITNAEFHQNKLNHVIFTNTDINELSNFQTSLKTCDISKSYFETLTINKEDLVGCKISREQAIQFASLMGLIVVDD